MSDYIHGFSEAEQERLMSQAHFLAQYIFDGFDLSQSRHVLEVGCGVGAETILLLEKYPNLRITGLEYSTVQLEKAHHNLSKHPHLNGRWELRQADARDLGDFDGSPYDAAIFIWVLEHVPSPEKALSEMARVLRPGTRVLATEVFNSSLFLYPPCPKLMEYWRQGIQFQRSIGGDGDIGPRLGYLFADAGLKNIREATKFMQFDKRCPEERLEMLQYWKSLVHSSLESLSSAGWATEALWEQAAAELDGLMQHPEAVFYYHPIQIEGVV